MPCTCHSVPHLATHSTPTLTHAIQLIHMLPHTLVQEIAVSSGSACTSASLEPSYVLRALGVEEELAHTSIRYGMGRFTTEAVSGRLKGAGERR